MSYKTYENYVDSEVDWIGLLPSTWQILKSKFIFTRINIQSTTGNEELLSVSEYYGVKPKKETIEEGDFISRAESLIGYKKCSKNDLVMNIMLAWKKGLGVTKYEGIVSPAYEIFNINTKIAQPKYMNYLLRTDLYASEFKRHSYGVIDSRLRLYPDNFKEIECILPSIKEQKQIANYLDKQTCKIDETIAKNEELIKLLEEKRVALINQVVTKGLNPNTPMKDSGVEWIGEIPEHWEVINLKKCCETITDGSHFSPETTSEGKYYITVRDVGESSIDFNNAPKISVEDYNVLKSNGCEPKKGDVLLSKDGTVGKCIIVNETDFVILSSLGLLRPNNLIKSEYLRYYLLSDINIKQMYSHIRGSAIKRLTISIIKELLLIHPPSSEQEDIVNYLNPNMARINGTINKIQENIKLLEEYKTSLIHHVVTGKIDVRGEEI